VTELIFQSNPVALVVAILALLLLAGEIPYYFGRRYREMLGFDRDAWAVVLGGLLTLTAFTLGLSYAQSQGRFDARRALVMREANAIGTTWLRAEVLPARDAERFRGTLTQYTRERLQAYATPGDRDLYRRVLRDNEAQQHELWGIAVAALRERPDDLGRSLLMSTLNETIDVSAEQLTALTSHVPTPVIALTFLLACVSSIAVGLRLARSDAPPLTLTVLWAIGLTVVFNLIIDYDRPRVGLVTVPLGALERQLDAMTGKPQLSTDRE
jgi:hypothetical protein